MKEEVELDEVSLGLAAKAYGKRASDSAESSHGGDDKGSEKSAAKADKTYDRISKKFGAMGADAANKSFIKQHFGEEEMKKEELKGKQSKLDKNHNGKLDAQDFKILRKEGLEKMTPQQKAHEYNLDSAQREIDRRHGEGEDMTGAKINKTTYQIIKPKQSVEEEKEPSFTGSHQGKTTIKHIKNPTVQQRMYAHDIKPGVAGYRDRIAVLKDAERMGNLKKEEAPPFDKPYHNTGEVKKDKYGNIVKNVAKHLAKKGMPPAPKNEEVEELDELNKDTLHSYAKKAEVDQDKQFTKVGKAIRDNDPETGNKAGHKFSKRSVGLTKAYGKLEKESIGGISSMSEAEDKVEGETDMNTKTVDGLRGRVKVPATFHNSLRSYKVGLKSEGKHPEDNSVPFVTDETSHTPMKLAKELAQKSFKKIRTETLGKDDGTSEETKHD